MAATSHAIDTSSSESAENSDGFESDENETEYELFQGVQGYQFEPVRRQNETQQREDEAREADGAGAGPQERNADRVGHVNWLVADNFTV